MGSHTDLYRPISMSVNELTKAEKEIEMLRNAIRKHRDEGGDNRCWKDDEELYQILPEGYNPPIRDTSVELQNCVKYICNRKNPLTVYVSPQIEIERLRKTIVVLEEMIQKLLEIKGDGK